MTGLQPPSLSLAEIASCLEGVIPSPLATCSANGTPNITYLSIARQVDVDHIAVSNQFFSKTKRNLQENAQAQLLVVEPETCRQFLLDLEYVKTEHNGAVFEQMNSRLEAIASQTGMAGVFKLRGVDIYRVLHCSACQDPPQDDWSQPSSAELLHALETLTEQLATCSDFDAFLTICLESLFTVFGYEHSFLLVPDEDGKKLFTLVSRGFPAAGIGSEVTIGEGIIGVVATSRSPVRIGNMTREITYSRAVRSGMEHSGAAGLAREIPLPGLTDVQSQLAVPLLAHNQFLGVLCLQSPLPGRFTAIDEKLALVAGRHIAAAMAILRHDGAQDAPAPTTAAVPDPSVREARPCAVRHYDSDDSVFIDGAYLVKGVSGRIFWKLAQMHLEEGRAEFTNKEIRLDPALRLPDIKDNLETRLILLRRRLEEHCDFLRIAPTGRGRFRLEVRRKLLLEAR